MPRLLALTHSAFDPASRLRVLQWLPRFRAAGWEVRHQAWFPSLYREPWFRAGPAAALEARLANGARRLLALPAVLAAGGFDAVLVGRELPCLQDLLLARTGRVVMDVDDAIHLGAGGPRILEAWRRAAVVVAGNDELAGAARAAGARVRVIPTVVDPPAFLAGPPPREGRVRVGWMGSPWSVRETLGPFLPLLAKLQQELGFAFVVVSSRPETVPASDLSYEFVPWSPAREAAVAEVMDIGLMPLEDGPRARAKCGAKLLQYGAAGLPVVASPVGVNRTLVEPGATGFLAATGDEWRAALAALVRDRALRARLGEAGRARVQAGYSLDRWQGDWLAVLDEVARLRPGADAPPR